ncbi:hypothetical protein WJX72_007436 [[Myrmecia] bisecta]|uniref:Condensation domain-containing protein n=1 Tax=[Myrmecia] bisecta TaxID=41462 RepID=A0AAW1Q0G0_9CHLO
MEVPVVFRPLQLWEQVCSVMNVSLAIELEGHVQPSQIEGALEAVRAEYPYLRSVLKVADDKLCFVESSVQNSLSVFPDTTQDWQSILVKAANKPRDHSQGVVFLELHSTPDGLQHTLCAVFNHGGTDALGIFNMLNTMFSQLGNLAAGKPLSIRPPRELIDMLARIPDSVATEPKPEIPAAYMPVLEAVPEAQRPSHNAFAGAIWSDWPEALTGALLSNDE